MIRAVPDTPPTRLRAAPRMAGLYARAVLPKRPAGAVPPRRLLLPDAVADPGRLARYARVCGFAERATLPPTYPHIVAFPLALSLMARRDFPYPLLGLVHLANRVEQLRPIPAAEPLSYEVWVDPARPHPRGTAFDVLARATDGAGAPAWRSVSTFLRRGAGPGAPAEGAGAPSSPPGGTAAGGAPTGEGAAAAAVGAVLPAAGAELDESWRVPAATGRHYARVSGDRNPIHLHPLTARAFGFPRAIAHGMWTKARCLAALEGRLADAFAVEVEFRKPVPLPGRVRFRATAGGDAGAFEVTGEDGERPHLRGRLTAP